MKIQTRLTLIFASLVAAILFVASWSIYYSQVTDRETSFYNKLYNLSTNYSRFLLVTANVDSNFLHTLSNKRQGKLVNEEIMVFDKQGNKLYDSDSNLTLSIDKKLFNEVLLYGKAKFKINQTEGLGIHFTEQGKDAVTFVAGIDKTGFLKLSLLRNRIMIIYLLCLLMSIIASWILAGTAMKPLSKMIKQLELIDYGNLTARIQAGKSHDEMGQLSQTFNNMLDRLDTTFKVQKDFVANASHELRTPLTSITGQLEVMLMKERSSDEYKLVLESILDDIKNLSLTSNRLLMLAQASSKMTEFSFAPIRIDEVLWQSQSELVKRREDYKVEIVFYDLPEDEMQLTVKGNEQLLKTMAGNLMENGCKYSADHTVKVQLTVYKDLVQLIFSDQGIGIEKTDLEHIFEPFYRTNNAITVKGHGLGLSLVRRIIDLHNGKIKVLSEPGVGSAFIITLPLA